MRQVVYNLKGIERERREGSLLVTLVPEPPGSPVLSRQLFLMLLDVSSAWTGTCVCFIHMHTYARARTPIAITRE